MSKTDQCGWRYGKESYGYAKFMCPVDFPLDMNCGYDSFKENYEPSRGDPIEHILTALKKCEYSKHKPHVVGWRGILSKLMMFPYIKEDFKFIAWKHFGVIYLNGRASEEKIEEELNQSEKLKRMVYSGFKFEEVCTRSDELKYVERNVTENDNYYHVFYTSIGKIRVIAAAEMDCFDSKRNLDVELKVTGENTNSFKTRNYLQFKLLKFYCQSFLAGVPQIVVGFRDDNMMVNRIEILETLKIPRMVRKSGYWDPNICISFLECFLEWLIKVLPDSNNDDENSQPCYMVKYDDKRKFVVSECARELNDLVDNNVYF